MQEMLIKSLGEFHATEPLGKSSLDSRARRVMAQAQRILNAAKKPSKQVKHTRVSKRITVKDWMANIRSGKMRLNNDAPPKNKKARKQWEANNRRGVAATSRAHVARKRLEGTASRSVRGNNPYKAFAPAGTKQTGEGSRGGHVIGRTKKSGKPIYSRWSNPNHASFTSQEHNQAARLHLEAAKAIKGLDPKSDKQRQLHMKRVSRHLRSSRRVSEGKMWKSLPQVEIISLAKAGEGSRGGQVVGHVPSSGKPIYGLATQKKTFGRGREVTKGQDHFHDSFTPGEHQEAHDYHMEMAKHQKTRTDKQRHYAMAYHHTMRAVQKKNA